MDHHQNIFMVMQSSKLKGKHTEYGGCMSHNLNWLKFNYVHDRKLIYWSVAHINSNYMDLLHLLDIIQIAIKVLNMHSDLLL